MLFRSGADEYTVPTVVDSHVGSGQTYTTLADWVTAKKGNLAIRDTVERALIHGTIIERVFINEEDWGCNNKNYLVIMPTPGQEHDGKWRTDRARIKMPIGGVGDDPLIILKAGGSRLGRGLVLDADSAGYSGFGSVRGIQVGGESPAPLIIDGVIFRTTSIRGYWGPSFIYSDGLVNYNKQIDGSYLKQHAIIKNCVISMLNGNYAQMFTISAGNFKIYNNVGVGKLTDNPYILYGGTLETIEENNYWRCKTIYNGVGIVKGTHTATENTEAATSSLRNIPYNTANFVNITPNTEDWHLPSGSYLIGRGVNLIAQGVTKDFEGQTRQIPFDIGADGLSGGRRKLFVFF